MKNKVIITLATVGLVGGSALLLIPSQVGAFGKEQAQSESGELPSFVQNLVDKYGLDQDSVKADFTAERETRRAEHQAEHKAAMDEAISSGVITQEQADALAAYREGNQPDREAMQAMSQEERQAAREEQKAAMEAFAAEQGIDLEALHEAVGGPRESMRGGRGMGRQQMSD